MKERIWRLKKNLCVSSNSSIDGSHTLGRQEIDSGDLETLDALLPANAGERKTLADLIFAKIDNNKEQTSIDNTPDPAAGLNPQVVEAYSKFVCFL